MFRGDAIKDLVELFNRRQVSLYHSCQFVDFQSYIRIGGIPSRKILTDCGYPFTGFATDQNDHNNGVWDKVFLNPLDFGEIFAFGSWGIPTVYGPIAFVVRPEALIGAEDVAICLRSAGTEGFKREEESLHSVQDINRLFVYGENRDFPDSAKIKWPGDLRREFKRDYASNPEISCSHLEGKFPLIFTSYLLIDPYMFGEESLTSVVEEWLETQGIKIEVKERGCYQERRRMYNELLCVLRGGFLSLQQLAQMDNISRELREWAQEIRKNKLDEQWSRFARYLREGTVDHIIT